MKAPRLGSAYLIQPPRDRGTLREAKANKVLIGAFLFFP